MIFFSGFCFRHEEALFKDFIQTNAYTVAGFSLGAIDAFEYVLKTSSRIDKLQLFSPAYFMDKDDKFKRAQLHYFQKDQDAYMRTFVQNCTYPSHQNISRYLCSGTKEQLDKLLHYEWKIEDLEILQKRNIDIEVFLGAKDKIIDTLAAKTFFLPYATVNLIKEGGHILYAKN